MKYQTFWAGSLLGAWTLLSVAEAQQTGRPVLSVTGVLGNRIELAWPISAGSFSVEQSGALLTSPWEAIPESPTSRAGNFVVSVVAGASSRFYRLRDGSVANPFQVLETAPKDGATEVGVTFRPKVTFSEAVNPATLTTNSFYATAAGRFLEATIVPANDGTFAWLFFRQPMPGGTEVRVILDGSRILSAKTGSMLDPDGDGLPGGVADFQFTTVSVQGLDGTSLAGIVADPGPDTIPRTADDFDAGADGRSGTSDDNFLLPIAGVKVFLLGREDQSIITGADGRFHFDSVPVGDVKVVIDGRTAANPPAGRYFPEMVIDAQMVAGQNNWTMTNGPEVYLPRLASTILQTIDVTKTNLIQTTPEGAQGLSAFQRSQLTIELAPNSLIGADGRALSSGQIGISTVPSDIVRDMLPPGVLQHTFDITVQAPGIATFATPAPMTFPNMFNTAPGTKLNFLSFDHTTGRLVIEGTATVSADGATVRTDPGTGITHPGWHGLTPPGAPNDPSDPPDPLCQEELIAADLADDELTDDRARPVAGHQIQAAAVRPNPPETEGIQDYFFKAGDNETSTMKFRNTSVPGPKQSTSTCDPRTAGPRPLVIKISIEGNTGTNRFLEGIEKYAVRPFLLKPSQEKILKVSLVPLLKKIKAIEVDRLYGAKVVIKSWPQGSPTALLLNKTIYIGRYLDAADADHTDGVVMFQDSAIGFSAFAGVTRARPTENHGVALTMITEDSEHFPPVGLNNALQFAPHSAESVLVGKVHVNNPEGGSMGELQLSGRGVLQDYYVNWPRIREILVEVGKGNIGNPTAAQKSFLSDAARIDQIISVAKSRSEDLLVAMFPGAIRAVTGPSANAINFVSYLKGESPNAATIRTNSLGTSQDRDFCSYTRHLCAADFEGKAPATGDDPVTELLKMLPDISHVEAVFRLNKSLNENPGGTIRLYLDQFFSASFSDTHERFVVSEDDFIDALVKAIPHEVGHALGMFHTFAADDKNPTGAWALDRFGKPLGSALVDVMGQGRTADAPNYSITLPAFQVALGTAYATPEVMKAFSYYAAVKRGATKYGDFFSFEADDTEQTVFAPSAEGTLVISTGEEDQLFENQEDFGRALIDGPDAQVVSKTFYLNNVGGRGINIRSFGLKDADPSFRISQGLQGATLAPQETLNLVVTFAPTNSGLAEATLVIEHDGPDSPTEVDLSGFGLSSGAAVRVSAENNNVVGAILGGPARVLREFGVIENQGSVELKITEVSGDQIFKPANLPAMGQNNPLKVQPGASFKFDLSFAPSAVGLERGQIHVLSDDSKSPDTLLQVVGTGLSGAGSTLDYGNDFVAMESPDFPEAPVLRAKSDQNGNFSFFLPPEQRYHSVIFDPVSGLIAHGLGMTAVSGKNTDLGIPSFLPSHAPDSDGDGLPDDVEFAIGTDPHRADTDGDGVDDFAAVMQGGDPLGGHAAVTGIIAQTTFGGEARDVTVLPNRTGDRLLAYVAASEAGLVILDVTRPTQPAVVGQTTFVFPNLLFQAQGRQVRVDPAWQIAAIVSDSVGGRALHLVDVSDPSRPVLTQSRAMTAISGVAVSDGYAYFDGNYSKLYALNLRSGVIERELDFPSIGLKGLAIESEFLYVLDNNSAFTIFEIHRSEIIRRGTLTLQGTPGEAPVVANGVAYVPMFGSFNPLTQVNVLGGYATVDVSDASNPVLLANSSVPQGSAEPGTALALSSSSYGLLIGRVPGAGNAADLLNVENLTNTYSFLTRFPLAETPYAVAIASGTAFIADGPAGLVTLSYQSLDTGGIPPVPRIIGVFSESAPTKATLDLIEGSRFRVQGSVRDDAQLQKVELLVNGRVVQTAVTVPLNLGGFAPNSGGGTNSFVIQLRAADTGGNIGLSEPAVIRLLPDVTAPALLGIDPAEGEQKLRGMESLRLFVSEPLAAASLNPANFDIVNENGTILRPIAFNLRDGDKEVELRTAPLGPGTYRLVIHAPTVTDRAGNRLGAENITRNFSVLSYSIRWAQTNTASWFVATNWVPARVPSARDWVYIGASAPGNYVFIPQSESSFALADPDLNTIHLRGLESDSDLLLYYATLQVDEPYVANGSLYLLGSKLRQTTVVAGTNTTLGYNGGRPTNPFVTKEGYFSVLDRVTLRGNVQVESEFHLIDTLTVQGTVEGRRNRNISRNGLLHATRDVVIQGPGTFHDMPMQISSGEANDPIRSGPLVTIGADVTFRGALDIGLEGSNARLLNRGKLLADDPLPFASGRYYSAIQMTGTGTGNPAEWIINEGTIEASNGYRLLVGGPFNTSLTNRGVLRASDRALLWVSVPLTSPKIRCETTAVVWLADRGAPWSTTPGQVSELSGPGTWLAADTEFQGGTIRLTDGALLEGAPVFKDVTFEGELHNYDPSSRRAQLPDYFTGYGSQVKVYTNLTLNGLIAFHRPSAVEYGGTLSFIGSQTTFNGNGRVEFEKSNPSNQIKAGLGDLSGQLTIGPGITIHGNNLTIGNLRGDFSQPPFIENQGTIQMQPGDFLSFGTYALTNSGVIHLAGTNTATVQFNFAQTSTGRLEFEASRGSSGPAVAMLRIGGSATLDGSVVLARVTGFEASIGDTFELLSYQSVRNQFKTVNTPPPPTGAVYTTIVQPASFRLELKTQ